MGHSLSVKSGPVGDPHAEGRAIRERGFDGLMLLKLMRKDAARVRQGNASSGKALPTATTLEGLYALRPKYKGTVLEYPTHLQPFIVQMKLHEERAVTMCLSVPPRHHKTTTVLMMLALMLLTRSDRHHFYLAYSTKRATDVFHDFSHLLQQLGIDHVAANSEITFRGSTVKFRGLAGGVTGYDCNGLCIIDDPFKSQEEAKSATERDNVWRHYLQDVETRQKGQMSIIVIHTRWDVDDLIGRMAKLGAQYINLKQTCDDAFDEAGNYVGDLKDRDPLMRKQGEPLLASDPESGRIIKEQDERVWSCMYQGEPAPEGMRIFETETTYSRLPNVPLIVLYGLDSAYAARKRSDWSVACRFLYDKATGIAYLDRVIRVQIGLERFGKFVADLQRTRPGPLFWFVGGQEMYAAADILRREGVKRMETITARGQLRVRVSRIAALWNSGKVLVPAVQSPEMQQFVEEVTTFTGDNRAHDDCVAALHGALHRVALGTLGTGPIVAPENDDIRDRMQVGRTAQQYERELTARMYANVRQSAYGSMHR